MSADIEATPELLATTRAAIREQACDRFLSEVLAPDARDWIAGFASRAALGALVEALGLTEERCCDQTYKDQEETGKYNVYTCADLERSCRTRLVSKWSQP